MNGMRVLGPTTLYLGLLIVLTTFGILSLVLTTQVSAPDRQFGELINLSGRQRMLTMRTALIAAEFTLGHQTERHGQVREEIRTLKDAITRGHAFVLSKASPVPGARQLLYGPEAHIDADVTALLDAARLFENALNTGGAWPAVAAGQLRAVATLRLVEDLDRLTFRFQQEAARLDEDIKFRLSAVTVMAVMLFLIGGVAVVVPLTTAKERSDKTAMVQARRRDAMLAAALDGIITVDRNGTIVEMNAAAEAMFGLREVDVIGHDIADLIVPDHLRQAHKEGLRRHLTDGSSSMLGRRVRTQAVRKDGSTFPVELAITRVEAAGKLFFTAYLRDLTEQLRHEEELGIADAVFRSVRQGIIVTDADTRILSANPAFLHMSGYAPEDLIGSKPSLLKSGLHDEDFYRGMWETIRTKGFWSGELWNARSGGEVYPQALTITKTLDALGAVVGYIGVSEDISRRKNDEETIWRHSHIDALTGLTNRSYFLETAKAALLSDGLAERRTAVMVVDLDHFKLLNESHGHPLGDELLVAAGRRLAHCVRSSDTVARLGGDEFGLLLTGVEAKADLEAVVQMVLGRLMEPYRLGGIEAVVGASIGIAVHPADGADADSLLKNADTALRVAKLAGRATHRFYVPGMGNAARERLHLEVQLRRAVEDWQEFSVAYQPIVDLDTGRVIAAEALVRWNSPDGPVPPDRFIPVAEETGLILPIGAWVLREACRAASAWRSAGLPELRVSVNLSGRQLAEVDVPELVAGVLRESGLPPSALKLEVTETVLMENMSETVAVLRTLADMGVSIMIDDFGTGYSSLSYLRHLPVQALKIDRSFIRDCPHDADSVTITRAVVALARSLNLDVVAEGIETEEHASFLREELCRYGQGYLYSRPVPADAFLALANAPSLSWKRRT